MRGLYFVVGSAAVGNLLLIQHFECVDGNLIDLARQAANPRSRCQLEKALHTVLSRQELDVNSLHGVFPEEKRLYPDKYTSSANIRRY